MKRPLPTGFYKHMVEDLNRDSKASVDPVCKVNVHLDMRLAT